MGKNIYCDGEYIKNNPLYHVADSSWKAQQIKKMVIKHELEVETICEIGCGAGEVLRQLQNQMTKNIRFFGYDISPQAFELCKQRSNENITFYCTDLLTKDIDPFDLILCIDVFEHVEDYMGFLRRLRNKGKYKVFHIPLEISVIKVIRYKRLLENRELVGHLHYFIKDTALLTLKDTGYEIVDYFYTPAGYYNKHDLRSRIIKKLPLLFGTDIIARMWGGYSLMVLAI